VGTDAAPTHPRTLAPAFLGLRRPLIAAALVAIVLVPLYATVVEYVGALVADHL
jgi:hypothetical protein